jgi:medium-chain acyl-[acyl-carrier-protein] hydrolase
MYTRLAPLVTDLADAMAEEVRYPFAFFGHSMGALISFELARELRRRHSAAPVHLYVSGRRAPQISHTELNIFDLPDDQFIKQMQRFNGTPREVLQNAELMELFLPVLRADFELVETYQYTPGEPLPCSITAYGGFEDEDAPQATVLAWEQQTSSNFASRMVPGGHFFIQSPLFRSTLADDLGEVAHKCC